MNSESLADAVLLKSEGYHGPGEQTMQMKEKW